MSPTRIFSIVLLLALTACSRPVMPESAAAPQIVGVRDVRVGEVTYQVSRRDGQQNHFKLVTANDRHGSKSGAATALIRAYNCQRAQVTEVKDGWKEAEGIGTFCRDRGWRPLR